MAFQLGGTLLDACVLGILAKEDTYGYNLTNDIKKVFDISDSTMYPVLKRLQKEGHVSVYDKAYEGRNRRYYKITLTGSQELKTYCAEWDDYKKNIDILLKGGLNDEPV